MDQNEDKTKNEAENNDAATDLNPTETVNKSDKVTSATETETPPVSTNKSNNKLALFLSLLALIAPAYLLYIEFLSNKKTLNTEVFDNQVKQLSEANKKLSEQLQNLSSRYDDELTLLKNELNQLKTQPSQAEGSLVFDNSENEAALSQLEQQLNEQMSNHAKAVTELKQQIKATQNSNTIAHEVLPETTEVYDRKHAIGALYAADLLIRTQRLPQAISTLQQLLATANLSTGTQQSINHLIMQWQQVEQPDITKLVQQLQKFKQQVRQLKLNTDKLNESESDSWYSRFVSVKKIQADSGLADSHALRLLQAELTQQLLQAEWALTLRQSDAWQTHLLSAVTALENQLPQEAILIKDLRELSSQNIVALMPTPSGIHDLINQLKGHR